ncbi:hypothetical protein [Streptomyces globisporus]|uniref:hypothetical protein n=1 Tax=Streptomyces globisporus TaxID=1908 RepID=UPI0005634B6C|nr:hypothetical protein [Streptomyces globisporus]
MLGYWLAVVRRLAVPALVTGLLCAAAMVAALVLGDGVPWREAAPQSLTAAAVGALAFAAVLSTATVVRAARTARRYGLALGPEAVALPCVREVRVSGIADRTAFQLTDGVRHAVEKDPVLRRDEVTAFGHGKLDLTVRGPSDTTVAVRVRITTGPERTIAVVEARPTATYKRLDAAACWAVARVLERRIEETLRAEVAEGGQTR